MNALGVLTLILLIVGGLNWGLVGALGVDLVAAIFGQSALANVVYLLVGSSAVFQLVRLLYPAPPQTASVRRVAAVVAIAGLTLLTSTAQAQTPAPKDIVDTAVANGSFKTLATALQAAGLVETLKGAGPFTVFAPTDAAFAKIPKETLDALLKDKQKLTAVLTYHVVAGKVAAADVVKLKSAKTLNGQEASIHAAGGSVMVGNAKVVQTDIMTSNGIIHVIDTVLMPPSK
jgi:uncharacterized surface protein with fasciclin (FAS1) repeats